ncbi:hypothetical protein [Diaphorobacter aerolatus]|uniref:hypothetical protein n=1 Tax=Diaphorobacter aerolatus TaxID=1288495 RepID=UPI001D022373|nr:hypothetical protein [Diaphorobacter aerolatus]
MRHQTPPIARRAQRMARPLGALCAGAVFVFASLAAQAQMVNYNEQLGNYKDMASTGVKLIDGVFPAVNAKARVNRAVAQNSLVDQSALVQPDGTLKLPDRQQNVVIRTDYNNVQRGSDGALRIASPVIQGNVSGNVTLYVEGRGVENITVLNSR